MTSAPMLSILERLVGFDTVSARSNLALIDYCRDVLARHGFEVATLPGPCGTKANLWARIGPDAPGGVMLSGHSDVVPTEGQDWSTAPFSLRVEGGRAWGRGTADMKGFLACVLSTAPRWATLPLSRPLFVAITFDEEVGCKGAPLLIDAIRRLGAPPAAVIVGEPTGMALVDAHKGLMLCRTTLRGVEAHSALSHLGVSAVALAARAVALLESMAADLDPQADRRFEPAGSTVTVNRIAGGTATNILAGGCHFDWDLRAVPGSGDNDFLHRFTDRLEAEIIGPCRDRHPGVAATTEVIARAPGLRADEDGAAHRLARQLLGPAAGKAVSYVAEAGLFQAADLSAVLVGPGSIEQAHKADEYVSLAQLGACEAFLHRLEVELTAG